MCSQYSFLSPPHFGLHLDLPFIDKFSSLILLKNPMKVNKKQKKDDWRPRYIKRSIEVEEQGLLFRGLYMFK